MPEGAVRRGAIPSTIAQGKHGKGVAKKSISL